MTEKATIETSKYFTYVVYDDGNVTKISRGEVEKETPLPRYTDDGGIFVWIGKNKRYVRFLVAKYFMGNAYRHGYVVENIDGNQDNCAVDNLLCFKREPESNNKIYTKVILDGIEYNSIAAAERALMVSNGYLTKYFKGQVAGKALEGHEVRLVKL